MNSMTRSQPLEEHSEKEKSECSGPRLAGPVRGQERTAVAGV